MAILTGFFAIFRPVSATLLTFAVSQILVGARIRSNIFLLCGANLTLATIFFSISAWQNHPINYWWIFKKKFQKISKNFKKFQKISKKFQKSKKKFKIFFGRFHALLIAKNFKKKFQKISNKKIKFLKKKFSKN